MLQSLRDHRVKIGLVLLIFFVFLFNILGLMDLRLYFSTGFTLRDDLASYVVSRIILTPHYFRTEFILFILTGILLSVCLPILNPIRASSLTLVCTLAPIYLKVSQPESGDFVTMEYHLLTILILFAVNVLVSYFIETREKQQLIDIFGHYVPRELVNQMSAHPESINLDGEARELTMLFCDIKGFTEVSERLDPRQLAAYLNAYFTALTRILYRHGATIDKYMGDAIMAFWGAPLAQDDHARRAVAAAMEIRATLPLLALEFEKKEWPPIELGIGINSGVVNVGNMGSEYRMAYTVVGDAVNLASRLEHLTRRYQIGIIISESTQLACADIACRELDQVKVKGKEKVTRIFEPLIAQAEIEESQTQFLQRHQQALQSYYQQDWDQAEQIFRQLQSERRDEAYYQLILTRISHFRDSPPASDWAGETAYSSV